MRRRKLLRGLQYCPPIGDGDLELQVAPLRSAHEVGGREHVAQEHKR